MPSKQHEKVIRPSTCGSAMKVAVHFGGGAGADALSPTRGETWGRLCQRFVEASLTHPPRLLRLLNSLHPGGGGYKFRYGDGRATVIHPTWSECGLNSGTIVEEARALVDANITLKPRDSSLGEVKNFTQVKVSASLKGRMQLDVDLYIEKVGVVAVPEEDDDDEVVPFLAQDPPLGNLSSFPMTQTPFPTDDSKTHVLSLKEHDSFQGVVDNFSIKHLNGDDVDVEMADTDDDNGKLACVDTGAAPAVEPAASPCPVGDDDGSKPLKKRNVIPTAAATAEDGDSGATLANQEEEDKEEKKNDWKKKEKKTKDTAKENLKNNTQENMKDKASKRMTPPALHSLAKEPSQTNGGEDELTIENPETNSTEHATAAFERKHPRRKKRPAAVGKSIDEMELASLSSSKRDEVWNSMLSPKEMGTKLGEAPKALDEKERQRYNDATQEAFDRFKEKHPNLPRNLKRKKEKEDSEPTGEQAEEEAGAKGAGAVDENDSHDENDDEAGEAKGENENGETVKRPKRPLNAYFLFLNDVRPKIKEENPGASITEITTKVGEAYRDLDDGAKKQYIEAAYAAKAKFKEQHGDESFKHKMKKVKNKNGDSSVRRHSFGDIPAKPAKQLPGGWVTRTIPRKSGDRADMFWFSPSESYKLRSLLEVKRFLESLEEVGSDNEVAAMKLYMEREKERRNGRDCGRDGSSGVKKKEKRQYQKGR